MPQPTPPAPPSVVQGVAVPRTRSQLDALSQLRSELREQLSSLNQRRIELIAQQRIVGSQDRAGIAGRIATVDQRTAMIEQQLQATDEAITAGIQRGLAVSSGDGGTRSIVTIPPLDTNLGKSVGNIMAANALSILLTAVVVWGIARRRLRSSGAAPAIADQARRLDQLQAAVDTMAVEVERISEGQRYVTKVLSERLPATTDRPS